MPNQLLSSFLRNLTWVFALIFIGLSQVQASFELSLNLDGNSYTAVLNRNDSLMKQIQDSNPLSDETDQHYLGNLAEVDDSWIRVSNIAGEWQGVVSAFQQVFVIDSGNVDHKLQRLGSASVAPGTLLTKPLSSFDHSEATCALDVGNHNHSRPDLFTASNKQPASAIKLPSVSQLQERSFNQLCTNKVSDGNGGELCLIAELELAFDQEYQAAVGANAASVATSIINVVDGFYRNNFNISFETLSRTMLTDGNDVFSNTTGAGTLLDDIKDRKEADGIAFLTNPNALFHFVTGRNFDGTTVGVAFLGVNCAKGFATGTSQLLGSGGSQVALTAAVIAHELGHNFGASHDIQNGSACPTGFIMSPSVDRNATQFSTCSISDIEGYLGSIEDSRFRAPLNACFNFPVDLGVAASGGNPTSVTKNQLFNSSYILTPKQATESIASATFSGNVNGGSIESVSIPSQACTIAGNKLSFSCTLSNFTAAANATLQMTASADQLDLALNTNVAGAQIRDIVSANNTLTTLFTASGGGGSDSTPDAFSFSDQTAVARNLSIVSNSIVVSGIDTVTAISVVGGEYSIDNGAFTAAIGSVVNGNSVRVRHTSSSTQLTAVDTTLTIGGVADTFSSTTAVNPPTDNIPNAFRFNDIAGVALSSTQTSNTVTISGIDVASTISVIGGEYSVDNGAFTDATGSVVNSNSVRVRHTSSATQLTVVNTTLTIGGVADTFSSTTAANPPTDNIPDAFTFNDVDSVAVSSTQTSNSVTISGIDTASAISVVGGQYSINNQPFTSSTGTVVNGNTVRVQHTASAVVATRTDTTLTIGGISNTFASTTSPASVTNPSPSGVGGGGGGGSLSLFSLLWLVGLNRMVPARKRVGLMKPARLLALLLPVTFLLACVSRTEAIAQPSVEMQYRQWSETSQNYDVSFQQLCFCLPDNIRPMRLTVRDNEIVKAIFEDDQSEVTTDVMIDLKTIDDIFQTIINAEALPAHSVKIEYDSDNHFPTKVDIDFDDRMADDELHWQLSNLNLLDID